METKHLLIFTEFSGAVLSYATFSLQPVDGTGRRMAPDVCEMEQKLAFFFPSVSSCFSSFARLRCVALIGAGRTRVSPLFFSPSSLSSRSTVVFPIIDARHIHRTWSLVLFAFLYFFFVCVPSFAVVSLHCVALIEAQRGRRWVCVCVFSFLCTELCFATFSVVPPSCYRVVPLLSVS